MMAPLSSVSVFIGPGMRLMEALELFDIPMLEPGPPEIAGAGTKLVIE